MSRTLHKCMSLKTPKDHEKETMSLKPSKSVTHPGKLWNLKP
jgi:hypothetical protein